MAVWERYKPLLENDYSRADYMMYVDAKTYANSKVSVLYIYVNYYVIFLQFIILKTIEFCIIYMQDHYTYGDHMAMVRVIRKLYCHQSEEELVQTIDQFWIEHEIFWSRTGLFQKSYIWKCFAIKD